MFCGWPNERSDDWLAQRLKLSELPFHYVRKYHGYAFSWAVIYTFWYHPMENTYGQGSTALYYSFYDQINLNSGLVDPLQSHARFYAHFFRDGPRVTDLPEDSSESLLATSARILGMVSRILCCCYGHI